MILQDIIDLSNDFQQRSKNYRGRPTNRESVQQINRALRTVGKAIKAYEPRAQLYIRADVQEYQLTSSRDMSRMIWRPHAVFVAGKRLTGPQGISAKLWSHGELEEMYPDWRSHGEGTPLRAIHYGNDRLLLDPMPDASTAMGGPHYVSGFYMPGAVLSDGSYAMLGFPTDNAADTGGMVTATAYSTFTNVQAVPAVTPDSVFTGSGNTQTLNAAVLKLGDTYPLSSPSATVAGFWGAAFGIPVGATINWVRIENAAIGSAQSHGVQFTLLTDSHVAGGSSLGSWSTYAPSGATIVETGPGPQWTGMSLADVQGTYFGLQATLALNPGHGSLSGNQTVDIDYLRLAVNYTVSSGTVGAPTSTLDLNATPDLPYELHEVLAYAASILAAEPFLSEDAMIRQVSAYDQRLGKLLRDAELENCRALSPTNRDKRSEFGWILGR